MCQAKGRTTPAEEWDHIIPLRETWLCLDWTLSYLFPLLGLVALVRFVWSHLPWIGGK